MYYGKDTVVFLNGEFIFASEAQTDLYGQSLHYGNGLFDGLRAYSTPLGPHVFKANQHFDRLLKTAQRFQIQLDYTAQELTNLTYELLERNHLTDAYIRPLIYFGQNMNLMMPTEEINIFIAAWRWGKYLGNDLLDVVLSSFQRPNPKSIWVDTKVTGHYINSILATSEAKQKGFDEAILADQNGYIAASPVANVFMERDGKLITPPEGQIVPGITRSTVFEMAEELDIEVEERLFYPEELEDADGAFFAGTASEISGVRSFNGKPMKKNWLDTLGHTLFTKYRQIVGQAEYDNYSII